MRRWVVVRHYGQARTPTRLRAWTRRGAERTAARMTRNSKWGGSYSTFDSWRLRTEHTDGSR